MSVVFVLTDKGWKDERSVKPGIGLYCFDLSKNCLDLQVVDVVEDVSRFNTYKVFNRQTGYATYVNEHLGLVAINDVTEQCYHTTIANIEFSRSQLMETYVPTMIRYIGPNVRQTTPDHKWDHDVKRREIGMFHFDLSCKFAAAYVDKWQAHYRRLNAVDYNQASMLQLVVLKSGKLSSIEQEIGFVVKPIETKFSRITDIEKSRFINITRSFNNDQGMIVPIRQINGSVIIG